MLFIDLVHPHQLRVNGQTSIGLHDPVRPSYEAMQLVVRVTAQDIFSNRPRYIHRLSLEAMSKYVPGPGISPQEPVWKEIHAFLDYLPHSEGPEDES